MPSASVRAASAANAASRRSARRPKRRSWSRASMSTCPSVSRPGSVSCTAGMGRHERRYPMPRPDGSCKPSRGPAARSACDMKSGREPENDTGRGAHLRWRTGGGPLRSEADLFSTKCAAPSSLFVPFRRGRWPPKRRDQPSHRCPARGTALPETGQSPGSARGSPFAGPARPSLSRRAGRPPGSGAHRL